MECKDISGYLWLTLSNDMDSQSAFVSQAEAHVEHGDQRDCSYTAVAG